MDYQTNEKFRDELFKTIGLEKVRSQIQCFLNVGVTNSPDRGNKQVSKFVNNLNRTFLEINLLRLHVLPSQKIG